MGQVLILAQRIGYLAFKIARIKPRPLYPIPYILTFFNRTIGFLEENLLFTVIILTLRCDSLYYSKRGIILFVFFVKNRLFGVKTWRNPGRIKQEGL